MFLIQKRCYRSFWAFFSLVAISYLKISPIMAMVALQPFWGVNQSPWAVCDFYFPYYEKQYNIPAGLLRSVALVESGRYRPKKDEKIPWPWTVNIEGKGFTYTTKIEAIAAVRQAQKLGKHSIDVGCMQVNLKWHPGVFDNLEQAFEPYHNIAYAAQFLTNLKKGKGSWEEAVAFYHSATKGLSRPYKKKVMHHWSQELRKNAVARVLPQQTIEQINKQVLLKKPRKPLFSYMIPYSNGVHKNTIQTAKESMWQNTQNNSTFESHNDSRDTKEKSRIINQDDGQNYLKDKIPHPLQSVILSD